MPPWPIEGAAVAPPGQTYRSEPYMGSFQTTNTKSFTVAVHGHKVDVDEIIPYTVNTHSGRCCVVDNLRIKTMSGSKSYRAQPSVKI